MGQVPPFSHFLLIGDGRVSRHFQHYLTLAGVPFQQWSRSPSTLQTAAQVIREQRLTLQRMAREASHILLLISDSAIDPFVSENPFLLDRTCLHMSGALSLATIPSAHPLMTFSDRLYTLDEYRQIPFVLEKGRGTPEQLLPKLSNPFFTIESTQKPLYHALCALSGNGAVLLWEKAFAEFTETLGLSKEVLLPYLKQVTQNLVHSASGQSVLTGPIARGDQAMVAAHLKALSDDPFAKVYQSLATTKLAPKETT